jgi:hypothetical protein
MMEEEPLDSELAAREDIAVMREQIARMMQSLGAMEREVRLREAEFMAIRAHRKVEEWEDD